jgi:DNA-binding LytR/AlgR family response regulator
MNKIKVVIVEDEALIADHIASILESANYQVLEIFDEATPFLTYLESSTPDLVLLDIQLNGNLDGVDIAHEINKLYNFPIVFLTSNTDSKTVERIKRTIPAGFITKPYTPDGLISNLEITLHNYHKTKNVATEAQPLSDNSIFIKDKNELIKLAYNDISHVQAMDNYAIIYTTAKKYIVPHTLKKLEEDLSPHGFIKTHRSYLINKEKITNVLPNKIKLGIVEIPLAESHRSGVLSQLNLL